MTVATTWPLTVNDFVLVLLILLLGIFTFFGTLNLLFSWRFRPTSRIRPHPNPGRVAILVPVKDDPSIFNSLPCLRSIDYPDYEVLIVDDSKSQAFRDSLDACMEGIVTVLRRGQASGRKAGALNFALEHLDSHPPRFVVILDADHRPPRDFLAKAVTAIEETGADCVSGYQKHDIGSHGFFGLFYRASQAATMVNLKARYDLGFAPVFSGAAAIFDYAWLRKMGFDETSITEDWDLSLRAHANGGFKIVVREDLWVSAAVPRDLRWYIRQQLRWTEGTTRDFRKRFRNLRNSNLTMSAKVGLSYQGLLAIQNPSFLLFWIILPAFFPHVLPLAITLVFMVFLGFAWGWPLSHACQFEGFTKRQVAAALAFGFIIPYVVAPFGTYAFLIGAIRSRSQWLVTRRRG